MLEQQRIEYLQAMGIQLWMPRQPVAHAAESLWLAGAESHPEAGNTSAEHIKAGHAADLLADMGLVNAAPIQQPTSKPIAKALKQESAQPEAASGLPAATPEQNIEPAVNDRPVDLTVPEFELHFALWPCGILWVSGQVFDQGDYRFQTSVSYALLGSTVPQANYSHFKWPYIQGSNEDQSTAVALRALTVQWEFLSSQGARAWVAVDSSGLEWLSKVANKPLYAVDEKDELFTLIGKKQLWQALQTLPPMTLS